MLHAAGAERVREGAEHLPADVRRPDLVHHLGEGRFAIVLPESSLNDAERLARRLRPTLGEVPAPAAFVELRFEDDAISLLERAESALAGAELLSTAGRSWSETVEPGGGAE
jgi:GGDEF domain-containing protein